MQLSCLRRLWHLALRQAECRRSASVAVANALFLVTRSSFFKLNGRSVLSAQKSCSHVSEGTTGRKRPCTVPEAACAAPRGAGAPGAPASV
jgi:hypothetical protein